MALRAGDDVALTALRSALLDAREGDDERPALIVLAGVFGELGVPAVPPRISGSSVGEGRDAWLLRLRSAGRSQSSIVAYANVIGDLLEWAAREGLEGELFEERTVVDYLDDYNRRRSPAPATYHQRFVLLRCFMRWMSQRARLPDPFADLEVPPRPRQEADWLTPQEFAALLAAAGRPPRRIPGLAERDRLVLLALVTTGLRRTELISVDWRDLVLNDEWPTLLVRRGKGAKPRRQALPPQLVSELRELRRRCDGAPDDPVFCGLRGGRLQPTILADIIARSATRARLGKRVTAHTLRHTAATWLRQATADARLVAEYLGHADLSTVSRYAHVASPELHAAARTLATRAGYPPPVEPTDGEQRRAA
jgi:integrase/recombinase XerC